MSRAKHKAKCIIQEEKRYDVLKIMNAYFFMKRTNDSQLHKAKTTGAQQHKMEKLSRQ